MLALIVKTPFLNYALTQIVKDAKEIEAILKGEHAHNVNRLELPDEDTEQE